MIKKNQEIKENVNILKKSIFNLDRNQKDYLVHKNNIKKQIVILQKRSNSLKKLIIDFQTTISNQFYNFSLLEIESCKKEQYKFDWKQDGF